jgi:phosphoribosylformylglycinamidine synthase
MKYLLKIEVSSKPGTSDPEGETTADLLKELRYKVQAVKVGKVYCIILEVESKEKAHIEAVEMCKRLLANPTKDEFEIAIEETK